MQPSEDQRQPRRDGARGLREGGAIGVGRAGCACGQQRHLRMCPWTSEELAGRQVGALGSEGRMKTEGESRVEMQQKRSRVRGRVWKEDDIRLAYAEEASRILTSNHHDL